MTKTKKTLIIVLSVLIGLILLGVLLFFTAFSLRKFEIEFETTTINLSSEQKQQEILDSIDGYLHKSVFLMDKQGIQNTIENKFPYAQVVNIEVRFPRRAIIHLAERQALFAFQKLDNFYITDQNLKVLEITPYESDKNNAIFVEELTPTNEQIDVCSILTFDKFDYDWFLKISQSLAENNRSKAEAMAYFKSLKFDVRINPATFENEITLNLFGHDGFCYKVHGFETNLTQKLNALFACDVEIDSHMRQNYTLIIFQNSLGEIDKLLKQNT